METIKEINTLKTNLVLVFKLILLLAISYVKAQDFVVTDKGVRSLNRDPDTRKDFANVFYKPQYTLFDLWSDEPIFSDSKGDYHIYFATNENKSPVAYTGNAYMLGALAVYKFKNYENCKNWCDGVKYIPTMKQKSSNHNQTTRIYPTKTFVKIVGINNVSKETLEEASMIIYNYFGYSTFVGENIILPINYYLDGLNTIDGNAFLKEYHSNTNNDLTVYITDKEINSRKINARGVSYIGGNLMLLQQGTYMRETLIHEMGHIFGLNHCDNLKCVMAIYNDEFDEGKFCDKCISSLAQHN
jgi:hypothetical protein